MGCCKPDREGLRVVQLLVVLAYRSLVKLGCDFAPLERRVFAPLERRVFRSSRAPCLSLLSSDVSFAPLERRVFRSSRATCLSLRRSGMCYARTSRLSAPRRLPYRSLVKLGCDFAPLERRVFAPLERDVYSSPAYKHSAP